MPFQVRWKSSTLDDFEGWYALLRLNGADRTKVAIDD